MRSLLQAFEDELHALGRMAEMAQTNLSAVLLHVVDDPVCHRDAQVLDLLTQRLYGMSGFLTALSPSIPRGWQLDPTDAVSQVSLGALADRLNGLPAQNADQEVGALELF